MTGTNDGPVASDDSQGTTENAILNSNVPAASDIDLRTVREQAERQAIVTALARANGNVVRASEFLGVSRPTLYDLLKQYRMQAA